MFEKLRSFVVGGSPTVVVRECRDCGTVVDGPGRCPNCESGDVARYEID